MEYIVIKEIPQEELTNYDNYLGFLFKNKNGVFNIPKNVEDIIKSNQWFGNLPVHAIVFSDDEIKINDVFLVYKSEDKNLNGKTFKYIKNIDLTTIEALDKDGEKYVLNNDILTYSVNFKRKANSKDKEKFLKHNIKTISDVQ